MSVFSQAHAFLQRKGWPRELASAWSAAREAFWIALEALRAHKLRSFLTLLGVVIATATLITVMSVINGMNLYIAEHIANLGVNAFAYSQFNWTMNYEEWLKARRRNKPVRLEDYAFLKENLRGYKAIGAEGGWSRHDVRYRGRVAYDIFVTGVSPSMIEAGLKQVDFGRYISDPDFEHSAEVCFIGQDIVNEFFANLDPLDKEVEIDGRPFRVIGVAKRLGTTFGESQDAFIEIPLTTVQKVFVSRPWMNVFVQAWSPAQMLELEDEVRALMRARHHLPYNADDDFGINTSDTIMGLWQRLTGSIFAVTIAVVAVFMVVGGIVIMNIMLASVTERTHEIGIRKSLGARRRDILMQFVAESAVMASVGGGMGVLVAIVISRIVEIFFTSAVPLSGVIVGLVLSTAVGLFFGIYPANQAARLDPIEALRTEN